MQVYGGSLRGQAVPARLSALVYVTGGLWAADRDLRPPGAVYQSTDDGQDRHLFSVKGKPPRRPAGGRGGGAKIAPRTLSWKLAVNYLPVWPEKGDAIDQRLIDYLKDTVINRDGLDNISTGWCALALFTIGQAKAHFFNLWQTGRRERYNCWKEPEN